MKPLSMFGVLLLILGALAFVIPVPHRDDHSLKVGDAKVTLQTESREKLPPAVGIILEVKTGEKVDAGSVLCRLYYTKEDRVDEAAEMVEDAFRISGQKPDERNLILEVVGV